MLAENEKHSSFYSQYMYNMCSDPIILLHYSPVMPMDQLRAEKKSEEPYTGFIPFFRKKNTRTSPGPRLMFYGL